jgi:alpha-beta hydrolase superfamily lysophospholipase
MTGGGGNIVLSTANAADRTVPRVFGKAYADTAAPRPREISQEAEASLRQFSLQRLMAYGVDYADARELRARVEQGEYWQTVGQDIAQTCINPPETALAPPSTFSLRQRLFRASALFRMSQMMFLEDNEERRAILDVAVRLYRDASALAGDRESVVIPTANGPLAGWLHHCDAATPVGVAIVIGGVEGWAMDFGGLGTALARRGVIALLLDGPGQGESRLVHQHYLTRNWSQSYRNVIDYLETNWPGLPIGFVGNSMGGAVATLVAAQDTRIQACVNNGGTLYPTRPASNPSFFRKMMTHCGSVTKDEAIGLWQTVEVLPHLQALRCSYLLVHGGKDPLISREEMDLALSGVDAADKALIVFSDGDHCVYNHEDDKQNVIADWLASRLSS